MRRNDLQNWTKRYTTRQWAELSLSNVQTDGKFLKSILFSILRVFILEWLKPGIKIYYCENCSNNPPSSQTFQFSSLLWLITEILTKEIKKEIDKNGGHLEKVIKNYYNMATPPLGGYSHVLPSKILFKAVLGMGRPEVTWFMRQFLTKRISSFLSTVG